MILKVKFLKCLNIIETFIVNYVYCIFDSFTVFLYTHAIPAPCHVSWKVLNLIFYLAFVTEVRSVKMFFQLRQRGSHWVPNSDLKEGGWWCQNQIVECSQWFDGRREVNIVVKNAQAFAQHFYFLVLNHPSELSHITCQHLLRSRSHGVD